MKDLRLREIKHSVQEYGRYIIIRRGVISNFGIIIMWRSDQGIESSLFATQALKALYVMMS